jgi:hypothetical protein
MFVYLLLAKHTTLIDIELNIDYYQELVLISIFEIIAGLSLAKL